MRALIFQHARVLSDDIGQDLKIFSGLQIYFAKQHFGMFWNRSQFREADTPMIVCQCNVISNRQIMDAAIALLKQDPWRPITPGLVYKELGKRHECCGCVPVVVDTIVKAVEQHRGQVINHEDDADRESRALNNPRLLQQRRTVLKVAKRKKARVYHERRSESYRAAQ